MSNTFGIDLGTCNVKVFCKATGKVLNEKNTIAIVNKNQMYAYGDQAYAMYEKAPENINVTFPVINGVIADYANMQTMIFEFLENIPRERCVEQSLSLPYQLILQRSRKRHFLTSLQRAR